jgi:hypothetical protein
VRAITSRWPNVMGSNDPGTTAILFMYPRLRTECFQQNMTSRKIAQN